MRKELSDDCLRCESRPACELAGQQYQKLEREASGLGFTVTEGALICGGRKPGSMLLDMDARCGAHLLPPDLASAEERERIAQLAEMDEEVISIFPATQATVQQLKT